MSISSNRRVLRYAAVWLLLLVVSAVAFVARPAAVQAEKPKTYYGDSAQLGDGIARTYVTIDDHKRPVAIGAEFTAAMLTNLPTTATDGHHCYEGHCVGGHERILDFPNQVANTPFQWLLLNWNTHGHVPDGVYSVPHFDFHFFIMDLATRNTIDPGPCGIVVDCEDYQRGIQPVPPQYLPQDYNDLGAVEAAMGNHLIDLTAPEFNGQPFTQTFIYGAYEGKISFYEPMITLAYFQTLPNHCVSLKLPAAYAVSAYYPTQYCMRYFAESATYTVSLEGFEYRAAA